MDQSLNLGRHVGLLHVSLEGRRVCLHLTQHCLHVWVLENRLDLRVGHCACTLLRIHRAALHVALNDPRYSVQAFSRLFVVRVNVEDFLVRRQRLVVLLRKVLARRAARVRLNVRRIALDRLVRVLHSVAHVESLLVRRAPVAPVGWIARITLNSLGVLFDSATEILGLEQLVPSLLGGQSLFRVQVRLGLLFLERFLPLFQLHVAGIRVDLHLRFFVLCDGLFNIALLEVRIAAAFHGLGYELVVVVVLTAKRDGAVALGDTPVIVFHGMVTGRYVGAVCHQRRVCLFRFLVLGNGLLVLFVLE
mmetsp:Transcript_166973/g.405808  ORF Transcript_166973/g.405808 Transcript_166973/m.405808 type:complete len:305 (-) Transcript_166973:587-1501(-)